jgi:hypothetical protein
MEPGKRGTRAYFDVDDIKAGAARVRELGGEADEPRPVPGMGWFATCKDIEGNEFGLWQERPVRPGANWLEINRRRRLRYCAACLRAAI